MNRVVIIILLFMAGSSFAGQSHLQDYISAALQNNLALQQKDFELEQNLAALDEARGMFLPSLSLNARYSRAGGGREIIFPVGDLLNPAYSSINQILTGMGQPAQPFPVLANEKIPFLREEEHDTKISLVQPLFNAAIYYNYRIRDELAQLKQFERDAFARQLVADIKTAWYSVRKTRAVVELLTATAELLDENLRVSEKLVANGQATKDVLYRAQAEKSALQRQQAEAVKNVRMAGAYLNFLCNFPLDSTVAADGMSVEPAQLITREDALNTARNQREEFRQLAAALSVAGNSVSLASTSLLPSLVLAADYGFQGESYSFTDKDDYWMASLVLNWNLFNGFRDRAKTEQARWEERRFRLELQELDRQIALQVTDAWYQMDVMEKELLAAREQVRAEAELFKIIEKRYREGMAAHIEYVDARNRLTSGRMAEIIAETNYQTAVAVLERTTASWPLSAVYDATEN
jgi:outer membrane protein